MERLLRFQAGQAVAGLSYIAMQVVREFVLSEDPLCGAEIGRKVKLGTGTLYPLLRRLTESGWLEHVGTLPGVDVPDSKFYRPTLLGHTQFREKLLALLIPDHEWKIPETKPLADPTTGDATK